MPYIPQEDRLNIKENRNAYNGAEVNYLTFKWLLTHYTNYASIDRMCQLIEYSIHSLCGGGSGYLPCTEYLDDFGKSFEEQVLDNISFKVIDHKEIVSGMRNAYLEFYIRYVRPEEDKKIKENGDITK